MGTIHHRKYGSKLLVLDVGNGGAAGEMTTDDNNNGSYELSMQYSRYYTNGRPKKDDSKSRLGLMI